MPGRAATVALVVAVVWFLKPFNDLDSARSSVVGSASEGHELGGLPPVIVSAAHQR